MKEILNRRFWIYFILTFLILEILFVLVTGNEYMDYFFDKSVTIPTAFKLCLLGAAVLLPASLCLSVAFVSFISFRHLSSEIDTNGFFKKLAIGLLFIIPLALGIYIYNLYIGPGIKVKTMEILWDMKIGNYPRYVDDSEYIPPRFENYGPSTSTKGVLYLRLDSLESVYGNLKTECSELLAQLPDSMATEAYDSYQLEPFEVTYQHAPEGLIVTDSLLYILHDIQKVELYDSANELHECYATLVDYRIEHYKRMLDSLSLIIEFLIFASLGYFLRKKTIKTILVTVGVFLLAALLLRQMTNLTDKYMRESKSMVNQYKNRRAG